MLITGQPRKFKKQTILITYKPVKLGKAGTIDIVEINTIKIKERIERHKGISRKKYGLQMFGFDDKLRYMWVFTDKQEIQLVARYLTLLIKGIKEGVIKEENISNNALNDNQFLKQ